MSIRSAALLSALITVGIGCGVPNRPAIRAVRASSCVITVAELRQSAGSSLYDALVVIRPTVLRRDSRGEFAVVIIDGAVSDDASSALHSLPIGEIALVRWLSAPQAAQRYPLQFGHAVLEVMTVHSREASAPHSSGCA